jgi:hypothetical protein
MSGGSWALFHVSKGLGQRRQRLGSITSCERLLLIAERDKPTRKLADHHPVKNAGDLQFVLVGRYGLNATAFIVMLAGLDSRHFFVLGSRSTCSLSSLRRPVIAEIEEKIGARTVHSCSI